jgi:hypothetical protein
MTTVIVSGAVANKHRHGGSVWVRMSWAEALRDAGFDVVFVEQIEAASCVDAAGAPAALEHSANLAVFRETMAAFGFAGSSALVCPDGPRVHGMDRDALFAHADDAQLLINIGGHLRWAPLLRRLRGPRVFVDLDPGFTQIWHAEGRDVGVDGHDVHVTVGTNVGRRGCPLPTGGLRWQPIRQPVALHRWPWADGDGPSRFTTVASWRGAFGPAAWAGRAYGVKAHQFRRFADVPREVDARFEVALDIHPGDAADQRRLCEGGWALVAPEVVGSTDGFRAYVQGSTAEFSPAQGIYVDSASGWFSDRTVRYLASGRPALVQDTGLAGGLPVGEGLLTFRTPDQAAAGARAIAAEYARHRIAARRIAEEHFAAPRAIAPLLEAAGVAP